MLYGAVYAPVQHTWLFEWVQLPLNPFPHPQRQACHRSHSVNAPGRPALRYGPSDDCRCERWRSWGYRDGEHIRRPRYARVRLGLRPTSNREQALIFTSVKS